VKNFGGMFDVKCSSHTRPHKESLRKILTWGIRDDHSIYPDLLSADSVLFQNGLAVRKSQRSRLGKYLPT